MVKCVLKWGVAHTKRRTRLLWTTNVSMVTKQSWSGYILPLHTRSRFQEHTWSSSVKPTNLSVYKILEPLHVHNVHMDSISYWSSVFSSVVKPILGGELGFFEPRTFPWSPSKVEVGTFYPFTLEAGSKNTLEVLVWSQQISPFIRYWNRCTCTTCTWTPFLIGQVCSQVWWSPYLAANFGFFELRTFPWSPSKAEAGTFHPFTLEVSRFHVYLHYTWSSSVKPTII